MPVRLFRASPSRLLAWLDCPRRYRLQYLDRPSPRLAPAAGPHLLRRRGAQRPARLVGPARGPAHRRGGCRAGAHLVDRLGFRDADQSLRVAEPARRSRSRPTSRASTRASQPLGIERTVSLKTERLALRAGSTGSTTVTASSSSSTTRPAGCPPPTTTPAPRCRWRCMPRRRGRCSAAGACGSSSTTCRAGPSPHTSTRASRSSARSTRPSRSPATPAGRGRLRRVRGRLRTLSRPTSTPLCQWCDFRAHCPAGQAAGPEKSDWAALDGETP